MKNNPEADPNKKSGKEESTKRHVYIEPGVQIDLVEDLRQKYEASQQENAAHSKKILLWTIIGAGLVFIYVAITTMQWWDLRQNFRIEQHAWIGFSHSWLDTAQIKEGTGIGAMVVLSNTGKTAAKNITVHFSVVIPLNTQAVDFNYDRPHAAGIIGMIPPNAAAPATPVQMLGVDQRPLLLTKDEADDLLNGRRYMAIFGQGEFIDIFGDSHWFRFCDWKSYYTGNGSVNGMGCTRYNDTGDGAAPQKQPH